MYRTLAAISLFSLAHTPAAQAQPKIEHITITVAGANDEWTPTPVRLEPGDLLISLATGSVTLGAFLGPIGPGGRPDGVGALQMKVGSTSVRPVGSRSLTEDETGQVKLKVLDTKYTDNSGSFVVRLIKIPAALIPAPTEISGDQ